MNQGNELQSPKPWWRIPLGIFSGLGALAFTLAGILTLAFNLLGEEGTFQPDSFHVTNTWLTIHLLAEILSGLAGGLVARWVGGNWSVWVLSSLLFALGAAGSWEKIREENQDQVRQAGQITSLDASNVAISPDWKHAITPFSLAGMALVAGWLVNRGSKTAQTPEGPSSA